MQAFLNCKLGQAVYIVKQHFVTLYLKTNPYFIAIPQKNTYITSLTQKNFLFHFIMNIRERIHVEREEEISFIFLTHDNNI